jgi:glycosyltransferase 2 family protein
VTTARVAGRWLRAAVAIGLLTWLLWISHPADIWRVASAARPAPLLIAIGLTFFDRALMAWRWLLLLRPVTATARPSLGRVMRIFFVSTFVGTFLPASVGGDLVRAYAVARERVPMTLSVASVAMDRALGVMSIVLLGVVSVVAAPDRAPAGVVALLWAGTIGCALLGFVVFSRRVARPIVQLVAWLPGAGLRRVTSGLLDAVREYRHHHGALASVLAGSVGVHVLRVVQAYFLGVSLGIALGLPAYFVAIPVILLIMLLPITMNGIGTSQAAFVWCFGAMGVGRPEAFALSVLFVALGIVGNLPGGLLYASGGVARQTA